MEHEHDRPQRPGDRPVSRHEDDEAARMTVDLDHAAVDPVAVWDPDGALRGARASRSGLSRCDERACAGTADAAMPSIASTAVTAPIVFELNGMVVPFSWVRWGWASQGRQQNRSERGAALTPISLS